MRLYEEYTRDKVQVDKTIADNIKALDEPINEVKRSYNSYLKALRELYILEENNSLEANKMYSELREKYSCLINTHNVCFNLNAKTSNAIRLAGKGLGFENNNWDYYLYNDVQ